MSRLHYSLLFAFLLLFPASAIAQIIPDNTLGPESSRAVSDTIDNLPSDRLTGGATRGVNLFHSFREFNINQGRAAYFENPSGIANIFTRITGSNSSNILGTIGVLGNANLFLINPKGIVFGPNARLDVRGSFLASSAGGVVFNNGFEFSAANPNAVPLLAINIPVGLSFRDHPGAIVNTSRVTQVIEGTEIPVGLAVSPGQTLALVGGDLTFNNGFASAFSGNIQLGSVASSGLVSFKIAPAGLGLDYTNVGNFGNIELSGLSAVTASGPGGGSIALRGGNVILRDRASLVSDTLGSINGRSIDIAAVRFSILDQAFVGATATGSGAGSNINIRAAEGVELRGIGFENFRRLVLEPGASQTAPDVASRESSIITGTSGSGRAGDIAIDSKQLNVRSGSSILNPTLGIGDGGNIAIRASESVEINASGLFTTAFNQGNAGTIQIETGKLSVRDGAVISPSTLAAGNSGNLIVRASDSVLVSKERPDSPLSTALATNSIGGTGRAGNIDITTRSLRVEEGASITSSSGLSTVAGLIPAGGPGGNITVNASDSIEVIGTAAGSRPSRSIIAAGTAGSGKGGDLTINTRRLIVRDGGGIGASTLGAGQGGNLTVSASESVEIAGTTRDGFFPSGLIAASGDLLYQSVFQISPPSGAAGDLSISTGRLSLRDGSTVNVQSFGSGSAGSLNVVANAIALDNKSSIDGTTASGVGGNVSLRSQSIQLRRNSRITTDAGAADGGNITLNSDILVGQGNSDITANSSAAGGRVNVNVPNVLGFTAAGREQIRSKLNLSDAQFAALQVSPTSLLKSSDIAAISQSAGPALQGTVTFSSSGVNPAQGLVELPQNVVDPAALIAANPCTLGAESAFTVTGRGGVPPTPNDVLSSAETPFPWVEIEGRSQREEGRRAEEERRKKEEGMKEEFVEIRDREVVPARGWVVNEKGEVTLVAASAAGQFPQRTRRPDSVCQPR